MRYLMSDEKGQQVILIALGLPVLIAVLGLVLDIGHVFVQQRRMQNAADAAAAAAGMVLYQRGQTVAINTARYYATQNGYTDNGVTVSVHVHQPPLSGSYANNSRFIQIQIWEKVRPIFAAIIWDGTFTVRATATAGYTARPLGADLWALKDTACDGYVSFYMNGNQGKVRCVNGVVQVNSICSNAVSAGNGNVDASTTGAVNISGPGYESRPNSIFTPPAVLNAPPVPDPLANLPTPSTSGCQVRTGPVNGKYLPGVYASDFVPDFSYPFDGSSGECNSVFYFQGSLSANGGLITVNKGMFFLESGGLTLGGNASLAATAPTSGTYAGMLIFLGRTNTSTVNLHGTPVVNCSTSSATIKGITYAPAGKVVVQGTSDQCFAGALLGWTFEHNGNATTTLVAYSGTQPGTRVTDSIVE